MKKLITLTALLLCAVVSTWAEEVTASWLAPSSSMVLTGTSSESAGLIANNATIASTLSYAGSWSKNSTYYYVLYNAEGQSLDTKNQINETKYIDFTATVPDGVTFTPSKVQLVAIGRSTGNNGYKVDFEDGVKTTNVQPVTGPGSGTESIVDYSFTSPSTYNAGVTLKIRVYIGINHSTNGRGVGLRDVKLIGTYEDTGATKYKITTSANNNEYGSVTATANYTEGNNAVITATSNYGYRFVSWTIDNVENASTTNPYTFSSINADHTIQAVFETARTINFSGYSEYNGTRDDNFAAEYADGSDKYTAPVNLYLSSDNQTLTGWNDGTTTFAVNEEIDCSTGNKTLSPVFTANSGASFAETLDSRIAGFTTTWNLGNNSGATFNVNGKTAYFVKQASVNSASVDIPMFIDASKGKFYNLGDDRASNAQINAGTKFRIPVVKGSVVTIVANYPFGTKVRGDGADCEQTKINGETTYDLSNSNKTATYTYSGETGTIDILFGGDIAYATSVSVTYPSPYSVTYDGNGAEIGSVADASTYDKNASVTTKNNGFVKTGYAFKEWNTEANGTGVSYFAGDKFTITDNTTLYAQWMEGTEATITYTLNVSDKENKDESTITSENASSSEQLNTLVGITNNTGGSYGTGDKAYMTVRIPTEASYNADHYMSVGFTVANGYLFTPTTISVKAQPVSTNKAVKLVLTDGVNSIEKIEEGVKQGELSTIILSNASSTTFTGAVTLKIYCYGDNKTYRLGSPITITGAVAPATTTVRTNAGNWASFTPSWNATLEDGATAYIITSVDGDAITASTVDVLKAGEGYFVKGDAANNDYTATATSEAATATDGNLIVGCTEATNINAGDKAKYVLGTNGSGKSGLFLVNSDVTVPAGKAFLQTKSAAARQFLSLDFDEVVTGIETVEAKKSLLDGEFFNLKGQRVAQPQKGLYILNGKKVVLK